MEQVSDRRGRTFVLGIHTIGLLFSDFIFIFVTLFAQHIPGGYWFLTLGPIVDGILGGNYIILGQVLLSL